MIAHRFGQCSYCYTRTYHDKFDAHRFAEGTQRFGVTDNAEFTCTIHWHTMGCFEASNGRYIHDDSALVAIRFAHIIDGTFGAIDCAKLLSILSLIKIMSFTKNRG